MSSLWSPFYQILDEPARFPHGHMSRRSAHSGSPHQDVYNSFSNSRSNGIFGRPAIDVNEEGDHYVVEADLPGVKRENLNVTVGDGGKSITIEGKIFSRRSYHDTSTSVGAGAYQGESGTTINNATTQGTTSNNQAGELKSEDPNNRSQVTQPSQGLASQFTRTVWLPEPVDGNKVTAKLNDGVLIVSIPKIVESKESIRVNID